MFLNSIVPIIIVGSIILLVALIIGIILIIKNKSNKKPKIDENFIKELVSILGGKQNIINVGNDNGRIKFELNDLSLANLEGLKSISQNGVFVTNNTVKTLFPHDAKTISNGIKNL